MPNSTNAATTQKLFAHPAPGDRVELIHEVKVGLKRWSRRTAGTVERTEQRRHGLHFRRNPDDKLISDLIVLKNDDGSQSTGIR